MPCHGCATNFSLFVTELSCPKCGFSFCSKCLKEKVNNGDGQQKVCKNCFREAMNDTSTSEARFDPPALLLKRLETLENPAKPPITIFKQTGKLSSLKAGLAPEDREIIDRLEKLKEDRKVQNLPSETEIKKRLLILKGLNVEKAQEKQTTLRPPSKSEQEEVEDLLTQYMNETILEGNIPETNVEDIEGRLRKLQTSDSARTPGDAVDADDGDCITKRMIEKAIAEAKLEKKWEESASKSDSDDDNASMDVDQEDSELPWCIICNEDATLKCLGCDGSLYCRTCFKQGHEFFEMQDHKTLQLEESQDAS